jgi:hypothetical protein
MAKKKQNIKSISSILASVERLFLKVIIGLVPPTFLLLVGWWGSIPFVNEETVKYFALGGLVLGVMLDMLFLKHWVYKAYGLPVTWFVVFYLFYSVALLGFFMGIPVFNLVLGIIGGYYVGICLRYKDTTKEVVAQYAQRTAFFTTGVLFIVCAASWLMAYFDTFLVSNIQSMFNLNQAISRGNILTIAGLGGVVLVAAEYFLTRATVKFARFL